MQRLLFSLALGSVFFTASVSLAEDAATEEQFSRDTQECTTQANADALDAGGDAQAIFFECMAKRGHSAEKLDSIEEEQ